MSEPSASSPLQFDQAEFAGEGDAPGSAACGLCHTVLQAEYFRAGALTCCSDCREKLEQELKRRPSMGMLVRALLLGSGAALLGAGLYYGITKITGYELGLVSMAVGILVGRAVHKGGGSRGGRAFQLMAVALAYLAMAGSYVPFVVEAMLKGPAATAPVAADPTGLGASAEGAGQGAATPGSAPAVEAAPGTEPGSGASDAVASERPAPTEGEGQEPAPGLLMGLALLAGLFLTLPIQVGFESPLSALIMLFALWEGWRVNGRVEVSIEGPFEIKSAGAPEGEQVPERAAHG